MKNNKYNVYCKSDRRFAEMTKDVLGFRVVETNDLADNVREMSGHFFKIKKGNVYLLFDEMEARDE